MSPVQNYTIYLCSVSIIIRCGTMYCKAAILLLLDQETKEAFKTTLASSSGLSYYTCHVCDSMINIGSFVCG
jgi:hypothetical protein